MIYSKKASLIFLLTCLWFFAAAFIQPAVASVNRIAKKSTLVEMGNLQTAELPLLLVSYMSFNGIGSLQPDDMPMSLTQQQPDGGQTGNASPETQNLSLSQRARISYMESPLKVKILLGIMFYLILSIFTMFIIIIVNRQLKTTKRRKTSELKNEYQQQLAAFLFDDTAERIEFTGIDIRQNRQIFINEMRVLHSNLYGETAQKLRDLYFNLELHKDSLRKVYHRSWHQKAKGFGEVAQMDVKDANDHIRSFVNSKNPIIRVEAQVAMVKLSEENPLEFLNDLRYELSEWEQINIYDTLIYHQINIDSFEPWLSSQNPSVVQFALRMIGLFKHMHSAEAVHRMIFHSNPRIRLAAITALKPLEVTEYIPDLKELYRQETHELMTILNQQREKGKRDIQSLDDLFHRKIRYAIVECLEPMASADDLDFLSEIAEDHESTFKIRILSIRIMASLHPEGDTRLEKLLSDADEILSTMIINVKQNLES